MQVIVEVFLFLVWFVFPFTMIGFALGTAFDDKATSRPLNICTDLEYILSAVVSLTGVFCQQFSIPFWKLDGSKTLGVTMIIGFTMTSMSSTRMLLEEEYIRLIQAFVNICAFWYLLLIWCDRMDRNAINRGEIDFGRSENIVEPNSSGDGEPNLIVDAQPNSSSDGEPNLIADVQQNSSVDIEPTTARQRRFASDDSQ